MFTLFMGYLLALSFDPISALVALVHQPQFWVSVLSLLTPLAIAVLKQPGLPEKWHRPLAWLFAGLVGLLTVYTAGQLNPADLFSSLLLIVAATEASYKVIWKGTYSLSLWEAFTNLPIFTKRAARRARAYDRYVS